MQSSAADSPPRPAAKKSKSGTSGTQSGAPQTRQKGVPSPTAASLPIKSGAKSKSSQGTPTKRPNTKKRTAESEADKQGSQAGKRGRLTASGSDADNSDGSSDGEEIEVGQKGAKSGPEEQKGQAGEGSGLDEGGEDVRFDEGEEEGEGPSRTVRDSTKRESTAAAGGAGTVESAEEDSPSSVTSFEYDEEDPQTMWKHQKDEWANYCRDRNCNEGLVKEHRTRLDGIGARATVLCYEKGNWPIEHGKWTIDYRVLRKYANLGLNVSCGLPQLPDLAGE